MHHQQHVVGHGQPADLLLETAHGLALLARWAPLLGHPQLASLIAWAHDVSSSAVAAAGRNRRSAYILPALSHNPRLAGGPIHPVRM